MNYVQIGDMAKNNGEVRQKINFKLKAYEHQGSQILWERFDLMECRPVSFTFYYEEYHFKTMKFFGRTYFLIFRLMKCCQIMFKKLPLPLRDITSSRCKDNPLKATLKLMQWHDLCSQSVVVKTFIAQPLGIKMQSHNRKSAIEDLMPNLSCAFVWKV